MDKKYKLFSDDDARTLFGRHDENLKLAEREFGIKIVGRGEDLTISAPEESAQSASRLFDQLLDIIRSGQVIRHHEVAYAIRALKDDEKLDLHSIYLYMI